jgi:hypothetical protein
MWTKSSHVVELAKATFDAAVHMKIDVAPNVASDESAAAPSQTFWREDNLPS